MKKSIYTFFVLALLTISNAFGQRPFIQLTYTATYGGQAVTLDSINIHNLTQGGDTTLFAPNTVLVLNYVTGIGDNIETGINLFSVSQNFPNPFDGKTSFMLNVPEKDLIKISVFDLIGREVANFADILDAGSHSFTFDAGNEKYYLPTATSSTASQSIKMMNFGNDRHQIKLDYQGKAESADFKSQKAISSFDYALGDQLQFIGYAATTYGVGSDVLEDAPQISNTYQFTILEGVPCPGTPTVTDTDGNIYKTVQIGDQCWMKENLKVGTMVNGGVEQTNNLIIEKYCYDNDPANCEVYGGLYQWDEMMEYSTTPGIMGICMTGWHLPTDEEWTSLSDFLGGEDIAGGKTKTTGTIEDGTGLWYSPNTGATNESGFTGLPVGFHYYDGSFGSLNDSGIWWSSTQGSPTKAWNRSLYYGGAGVDRYLSSKWYGFSVRCLRD
jgi:uncharacterized protein (TIGR02145 family)